MKVKVLQLSKLRYKSIFFLKIKIEAISTDLLLARDLSMSVSVRTRKMVTFS